MISDDLILLCLYPIVMGHVLATVFDVKNSIDVVQSLASKKDLTDREILHINAAKELSTGYDMQGF